MFSILAIAAKIGGWEVFNSVFSGITFIRDTSLGSFGGVYKYDGIHLNPRLMDQYVTTHEMGHVFDGLVYAVNHNVSLRNMLADTTITDNGDVHVTGLMDGNFNRTDRGYKDCGNNNACRFEEHPRYGADGQELADGNESFEDVADMFLNWVYDSFDYGEGANGAGTARRDWMDNNMPSWISLVQH